MCLACAALPVTETTKMRRHLIMSSGAPAVIGRSRAANMYHVSCIVCNIMYESMATCRQSRTHACVRACDVVQTRLGGHAWTVIRSVPWS